MIDLTRSLLLNLSYPDWKIDQRTLLFFIGKGMPPSNIIAINYDCSLIESRNRLMKDLVIPRAPNYEWFIFMDRDQYPLAGLTDIFLDDKEADVVGCGYNVDESNKGAAWLRPEDFHMGLVRVKSSIVSKLKPPWFMFTYNEDYTKITECECGYFKNKLLKQGVKIIRMGLVGHDRSNHSWHSSA